MSEDRPACLDHGVHVVDEYNPYVCADCGTQFCPDCGRELDSFACKIRHVNLQTGWAKSSHD